MATAVFLTVLAIIAAIFLLLVLLFFTVRIRAVLIYNADDGLRLKVSILSFKVFSTDEKDGDDKPHIRISDYKLGKLKKKKPKPKKVKKKQKEAPEEEKQSKKITDILHIVKLVISTFFDRYAKFLSVRTVRLNISVATGDAASTAILYGAVVQGVAYILEILNNITDLKSLKYSDVNVIPDYTAENFSADIKIVLKLPVWCAVSLILKSGIFTLSNKKESK